MKTYCCICILVIVVISQLFYLGGKTIDAIYWMLYVICGLLMFGHIGIFKSNK